VPLSESAITPFVEKLPVGSWLRSYLGYCYNSTDANLAYHLGAGLSLLSQTVPANMIVPFYGNGLHLNLFVLLIGDSTEARKTTTIDIAYKIMYETRRDSCLLPTGSWERFLDIVIERPQAILFDADFGASLSMMSRNYLQGMKGLFLKLYDCSAISGDTREKKRNKITSVVENPHISSLVGVTPSQLEEDTTTNDWAGGYLARFLTIFAARERPSKKYVQNTASEEQLWIRLRSMLSGDPNDVLRVNRVGKCLEIDEGAWALLNAFEAEMRSEAGRSARGIKAGINRSAAMAAKIAGLLAWDFGPARSGEDWTLTPDFLELGIEVVRNVHVASLNEIAKTISADPRERLKLRVLRAIQIDPTPYYVILRANSGMQARELYNWLETLTKERLIVRCPLIPGESDHSYRRWTADDDIMSPLISDDIFAM